MHCTTFISQGIKGITASLYHYNTLNISVRLHYICLSPGHEVPGRTKQRGIPQYWKSYAAQTGTSPAENSRFADLKSPAKAEAVRQASHRTLRVKGL